MCEEEKGEQERDETGKGICAGPQDIKRSQENRERGNDTHKDTTGGGKGICPGSQDTKGISSD